MLDNLPAVSGEFVRRRIYRSAAGAITPYTLVAEIDGPSTSYVDDGSTRAEMLDTAAFGVIRARPARPLGGGSGHGGEAAGSARIEADFGAQFIAEGLNGQEVIFTSRLDDSYGAGGRSTPTTTTSGPGARTRPVPASGVVSSCVRFEPRQH